MNERGSIPLKKPSSAAMRGILIDRVVFQPSRSSSSERDFP
ncbi:unnamed protein product, partial [Allacma fusca]